MGGQVEGGGLFVYLNGSLEPIVLDGDPVPGAEGETIRVFAAGNVTAAGAIAFTGETSAGVTGVFLATPSLAVPALSRVGVAFIVAMLALTGAAGHLLITLVRSPNSRRG